MKKTDKNSLLAKQKLLGTHVAFSIK